MSALKSSFLIYSSHSLPSIGVDVDYINHLPETIPSYLVFVVHIEKVSDKKVFDFCLRLQQKNPWTQFVLLAEVPFKEVDLQKAVTFFPFDKIIHFRPHGSIEEDLLHSLEKAETEKQNFQLEELVREQREALKKVYQELEERVEKRQNFLLESRKKTFLAQTRWEVLRQSLIAVQTASSLGEIEKSLASLLQPAFRIEQLRLLFSPQDEFFVKQIKALKAYSLQQAPLHKGPNIIGSLLILRQKEDPFSRDETDFFLRLSEAISLALDRISKLDQSETLKEQWEATFNAVSDPISIVNSQYEILQTNSIFWEKSSNPQGQKCYETLFGRSSPCPSCRLGTSFRTEGKRTFEVTSEALGLENNGTPSFVNVYHDVTEQLKLERKILESAKLAELGTIGSSIAHELNNPLGGILSFVQLIKMDLKKTDEIYPDIVEMEDGVRRCRDIIENLLGFTRAPQSLDNDEIDLKEVILKTLKIVELQTRSRGIQIKTQLPDSECMIHGNFNLLSQALGHIIQVCIDRLNEQSQIQKGFSSLIEIRLLISADKYEISVIDNSPGTQNSHSLSLSIAQQIFQDHRGQVELSSVEKSLFLAKISLPRLDFQPRA